MNIEYSLAVALRAFFSFSLGLCESDKVADPGGVDPDPTLKTNPDPGTTLEKQPGTGSDLI